MFFGMIKLMNQTAEDLARERSQKRAKGEKENNIFL